VRKRGIGVPLRKYATRVQRNNGESKFTHSHLPLLSLYSFIPPPPLSSSVEVETFKAKTITYITNTGVNPNIARHVVESINIEGLLLGGIDVTDITANSSIYRAKRRIVNPTSTNSPYNEYSTQDITRTLLVLSSALTSHIDSEFISYCRSTPQDLREPESVTKARDFIAASDIIKLEARRVYLEGKLKESEDKAARLDRAIKATEGK